MTEAPTRARISLAAGHQRAVATWRNAGQKRLGMRGYLCILGFLAAGPATSIDVAEQFGLARQPTRELIHRMGELGLVHTVGLLRTGRAGPMSPLWAYGAGPIERGGVPCRDRMPELVQLRHILSALEDPRRAKELAIEVGSSELLIRQLLADGQRLGLMHVCGWDTPHNPQGGGEPRACWVLGAGRSAPRPRPIGHLEVQRRKRRAETARREQQVMLNALCGRAPLATGAAA